MSVTANIMLRDIDEYEDVGVKDEGVCKDNIWGCMCDR